MTFPKPIREVDERFLDFIREQPCCLCYRWPTDPHHLDSRGSGGSDYSAVPLCRVCHTRAHQLGERLIRQRHGVDMREINARFRRAYQGRSHP